MLDAWRLKRILWSLRKAQLPIGSQDLVLDVGSGSNPHPAADILIERHIDSKHRFGAPFVSDRPTVLGDACKMPFKDKTFDFVIAFHVLEHMKEPALFLNELQRVGKAGYIETPNALFERLVPYDVHLLEIMNLEGTLIIHKKRTARPDPFLNELILVKRSQSWNHLFYRNPQLFHVCHFWKDNIKFKILNPEVSSDWFDEPSTDLTQETFNIGRSSFFDFRKNVLFLLRQWYKMGKKRVIDLESMLVCPECHGNLTKYDNILECLSCEICYPAKPFANFNQPVKKVN